MSTSTFKKNNDTSFVFSSEFVGFTNVPNYIFKDTRMSLKGIGLYCVLLQFQNIPNYSIYLKTIQKMYKDGKDSLRAAMNELETNGYIKREKKRNDKGHFVGTTYTIYMKPIEVKQEETSKNTECGKSSFGKSSFGKPAVNNKLSFSNQDLKKEEEDKANEIRILSKSDIDSLFTKLKEEYKDLLQVRSLNAVLKSVEITYSKTAGTPKHIVDLESYAVKCISNKITELESRKQEPQQVKQPKQSKTPIRTENVPDWLDEMKAEEKAKKERQAQDEDLFDVEAARRVLEEELKQFKKNDH